MTTSPVMEITNELLAELSGRGSSDTLCVKAAQHIRSLEARLTYIERNFVGASFNWEDNGMCVLAIKIGDSVPVTRDFMAVIDAAIASEGQSHE